jgi:aldose sugar dehydrogenase
MQRLLPFAKAVPLLALGWGLLACAGGESASGVTPGTPPVLATQPAPTLARVDTLLRNLEVPWGLIELENGGLFVAERPGRIRHRAAGSDTSTVWAALDVYAEEAGIGPESGLMGIALDPDTTGGQFLYALATTWRSAGDRERTLTARVRRRAAALASPAGALRYKNQVVRLSRGPSGELRTDIIVDDLPAAYYHAGGGIAFGPDGHLYVSVGDAILPELARNARAPIGKLLRYTRDGGIPADNPSPNSPVYSRGLRNTQAFAWLPDGTLIGVDHGPSGMDQEQGRQGHDELNVLRAGGDYGWPDVIGWDTADGITPPVWMWEQPIAPAGVAVLPSTSPDTAHVLVGGLRGHLERITLVRTSEGWAATARAQLAHGTFGRVRTVVVARDGSIVLTTSNRDARGVPRPGDDLVLRLTLAP